MRTRKEPKVYAAEATYLDPADCGSIVAYEIHEHRSRGFSAMIDLSDCSRKIQWYFSEPTGVRKIDKALQVLQNFRREYIKVISRRKPRQTKAKIR